MTHPLFDTPRIDFDPRVYRQRTFTQTRLSARLRLARFFHALKGTQAAPVPVGAVGGDVSKWQETLDWAKVKAGTPEQGAPGWEFVFIRWLFGLSVDAKAAGHWTGAGGVGLKRGGYAYYLDALDPYQQAQKLFTVLSDAGLGELPPVGDFEEISNAQLTPAKVKDYLEALTGFFGKLPLIYTGSPVWKKYFQNAAWAQVYPLWLAQYTLIGWQADHVNKVRNYPPTPPAPWFFWNEDAEAAPGEQAAWQITSSCPAALYGVSGTTVDLDFASPWFWAKYGGTPPPIVPPPPAEGETILKIAKCIQPKINARPQPNKAQDSGDLFNGQTITYFPEKIYKSPDGKEEWWPGITNHLVNGKPLIAFFAYKHPDFGSGFGLQDITPPPPPPPPVPTVLLQAIGDVNLRYYSETNAQGHPLMKLPPVGSRPKFQDGAQIVASPTLVNADGTVDYYQVLNGHLATPAAYTPPAGHTGWFVSELQVIITQL